MGVHWMAAVAKAPPVEPRPTDGQTDLASHVPSHKYEIIAIFVAEGC